MEVPLQVAARIREGGSPFDAVDGRVISYGGRGWPFDLAFGANAPQAQVYASLAGSQLSCFLDGCDVSVVVFGQRGSGKTYTLIGSDVDSVYDERERGIIPRFLCDTFQRLHQTPERSFVIHITWMRLVNGSVVDLLGCGLVRCATLAEAFEYLVKGYSNVCYERCHSVFTVSIEQKWIGAGGILCHRLSTASFCELSGYPEPGLLSVEDVIRSLLRTNDPKSVNYGQSLLTAMLRDSFGGRALTWIICCLGPESSSEISLKTLELCWCCRGVRNFVTVNGFADNNTPVNVNVPNETNGFSDRYFGLKFAAQQWIKLVSNAEGLFQKILQNDAPLGKSEIAQVNEWLFLKAECDECLNPNVLDSIENPGDLRQDNKNILPRIAEDTEPSEPSDSDDDSDTSVQHDDFLFTDKLRKYMEYFKEKTDELASDRCQEFLLYNASANVKISKNYPQRGRRKTIQPGESLSEDELKLLRRANAKAISPESQKIILESRKAYEDPEPKLVQRELLKIIDSPVPSESCKKFNVQLQKYTFKKNLIAKLTKAIQDSEIQLKELISLCIAKEQIIQDLSKIVKRQNGAKHFQNKESNAKDDLEKAKADLATAQAKFIGGDGDSKLSQEVQRCRAVVDQYEKFILDQELGKRIHGDNNKEIKKHENQLKSYKKRIDQIKKQIKRNEKRKSTLELELVKDKTKLDEIRDQSGGDSKFKIKKHPTFRQVSTRLSHLDNILKDRSSDSQDSDVSKCKELMLRKEIGDLRKTKECLLDQQCILGQKRRVQKSLSDSEERKLLEYEETIEAIDTAIEYKNELICGRGQNLIDLRSRRDCGEEMLMARLSKLSENEMRTLLYKYFQKVIDLRTTCTNLEATTGAAQQEAVDWKRRCADAWTALQHARLIHARRTTTLTARHYHTLNQLMREMTGDTESDSTVYNGMYNRMQPRAIEPEVNKFLTQHSHIAATTAKFKVKDDMVEKNTSIMNKIRVSSFHQNGIPTQNLRQLQLLNSDPTTKVTRQKNKLVIVQEDKQKK